MKKKIFPAALAGTLTAAAVGTLPVILLRNIGTLIYTFGGKLGLSSRETKQFGDIFAQLKEASFLPPFWLLILILLGGTAAAFWAASGSRRRRVTVTTVWIILLLPLFLLSLWFTHVNGIQFGAVLTALIGAVQAGVF